MAWIPPSPVPEILASNAVPSLDQIQAVHESLSTAQTNLSHLDQEISKTAAHLDKLNQTRHALQKYTAEHLALVAPARRLPLELWAEIFMRCSKGLTRSFVPSVRDSFDAKTGPLLLTHVCSWWRAIAISTPALWTSIRLVLSLPKTSHIHLVNTWAMRSGTLPLTVAVLEAKPDPYYNPVNWEKHTALTLLVNQSYRWADVFLMLPPYALTWQAFGRIRNNLPQLRSLSINTSRGSWPINMAMDIFEFAPQLSSLTLDHAGSAIVNLFKLPFLNLTFLEVRNGTSTASFETCFFAMRSMLNLRKCIIRCNSSFGSEATLPDTTLSHLTKFTIVLEQSIFPAPLGLGKMFSALSLPSLHVLELRVKNTLEDEPPWDHEPFVEFIRRSPVLCHLMLDYASITNEQFEEILQQAPRVKHLRIRTDSPNTILMQIVNVPLLPKLRTIKVLDTSDTQLALRDGFSHLVTSRGVGHEGQTARLRFANFRCLKPIGEQLWEKSLKEAEEVMETYGQHGLHLRIEQPDGAYDSSLHWEQLEGERLSSSPSNC